jgi:hypothetical protein
MAALALAFAHPALELLGLIKPAQKPVKRRRVYTNVLTSSFLAIRLIHQSNFSGAFNGSRRQN